MPARDNAAAEVSSAVARRQDQRPDCDAYRDLTRTDIWSCYDPGTIETLIRIGGCGPSSVTG